MAPASGHRPATGQRASGLIYQARRGWHDRPKKTRQVTQTEIIVLATIKQTLANHLGQQPLWITLANPVQPGDQGTAWPTQTRRDSLRERDWYTIRALRF